jgi:hypothetical protein
VGAYSWRGVTTRKIYRFMQLAIPSALIDPVTGQPMQQALFNGETVIAANTDGSVALPVATGPPAGASTSPKPYGADDDDIYSAYVKQSPWTSQ